MPQMKLKFFKFSRRPNISSITRPLPIFKCLLIMNIAWFITMLALYGGNLLTFLQGALKHEAKLTDRSTNIAVMTLKQETTEIGYDDNLNAVTSIELATIEFENRENFNINNFIDYSTMRKRIVSKNVKLNRKASSGYYNSSKLVYKPIVDKGFLGAPGEMGRPVYLAKDMSAEMKKAVDEGWNKHRFNEYVSDLISLNRTLPDLRNEWCKQPEHYLKNLPTTDVIICFHNEAWSTLLRTVHSVLNRSPPKLINKIILVDDYSDMEHLKGKLQAYFKNYTKVQIIRASKREGLIRARLLGAGQAMAPILTFLDAHCECAEGWLEPLLDRIARKGNAVVYPDIAVINMTTFQYSNVGNLIGGFDWRLIFDWIPIPMRERKRRMHAMEPVYSPTMPGGIFSINRTFFEYLGAYDSGYDIWGAENLELSFKTWMCGGTLEMIPCSFVGHVFRTNSPYNWVGEYGLRRNYLRLAKVWMDNYAKYYYRSINFEKDDYGDIQSRIKLRNSLDCKSFKWYLKNVYPELEVPKDLLSAGEIRNLGAGGDACLDMIEIKQSAEPVGLWPCHGKGGNQHWVMTAIGEIRHMNFCLDYAGWDVFVNGCHGKKGNQRWLYVMEYRLLVQETSGWCLTISSNKEKAIMQQCEPGNLRQQWLLEQYEDLE